MVRDLKYYTMILKESAENLSILYVEDDPDVREGIEVILSKFFKNITLAEDGQQGLEKYKAGVYDVVMTDISMPNMNGVEMSTLIKVENYDQPIIVLSAHNEGEYLIDLINVGIDAFLLKPIQTEQLVRTLSKICKAINDRNMLAMYQEKMEDSYVEMMHQKEELERRLNAQLDSENKNIVLVEAYKEKEDHPIQQESLQFLAKEFDHICAREFIENYPTDLDIYSDKLLNIGEKMDLRVNTFVQNPTEEGASELSNYFAQYAEVLSNIPEFINLNYAITQLSEVFAQMDVTKEIAAYFDLVLSISQELERWRESIFETQEAENIHYLDNSLISDCVMLESFVLGSSDTGDSGEDDIEFF